VAVAPKQLLAKSYAGYPGPAPRYARLTEHSCDVATACHALLELVGRLALEAAGLDKHEFWRFERVLVLNGWLQDLGKANSHFLALVTTDPEIRQLLRHETISAGLAWCYQPLRTWLELVGDDVLLPALWGAVGHHRKFDEETAPNQCTALTIHATHADFHALLVDLARDLALPSPPRMERDIVVGYDHGDLPAKQLVRRLQEDFTDRETHFASLESRKLVALTKGLGIAADVTASAIARRSQDRGAVPSFVRAQLRTGLEASDFDRLISVWAWNARAPGASAPSDNSLPPGFVTRHFQNQVAASLSYLTLAEAGCGSGKSLAAYLWARSWGERVQTGSMRTFRLFFCLPTTGTATEHFKDYALECGVPADLAHSRSVVDLEQLSETAAQEETDITDSVDPASAALQARMDKIDALALWSTPLVVGTADTVLGVMANARKSLCTLPAILQSAIVFDEVHAFDDQLFGHLLQFLRLFPRLPVLLMTASLPETRRAALRSVRPDLHIVPGPSELEDIERYHICRSSESVAWNAVEGVLATGGRALWVRNRVDWANETWRDARRRFSAAEVYVYHSRFRYRDRSGRHRRVIDAFKAGAPNGVLLVATQVAEMSLDLSADVLVSDIAPVPALIQRLGRLNRQALPGSEAKPGIVVPLVSGATEPFAPYSKDEIVLADRWLDRLIGDNKPRSQRQLGLAFSAVAPGSCFDLDRAERASSFLGYAGDSGLWRTRPGMTRADGYTTPVLLQADSDAWRAARGSASPPASWLRRHEVSIPAKPQVAKWPRLGGVPIAPSTEVAYDFDDTTHEGTGARWLVR